MNRLAILAQLEATRMTVVAAASQLEAMVTALAEEPEEEPEEEPRCPTCKSAGAVKAGRNAAGQPELLCPNNHSFVATEAA